MYNVRPYAMNNEQWAMSSTWAFEHYYDQNIYSTLIWWYYQSLGFSSMLNVEQSNVVHRTSHVIFHLFCFFYFFFSLIQCIKSRHFTARNHFLHCIYNIHYTYNKRYISQQNEHVALTWHKLHYIYNTQYKRISIFQYILKITLTETPYWRTENLFPISFSIFGCRCHSKLNASPATLMWILFIYKK